MIEFLFLPENIFYTASLIFIVSIGVLELLGLIFGLSFFSFLNDLFSFEASVDVDSVGGIAGLCGWLYLNRLPFMVWLVLLCTVFAIVGYCISFALIAASASIMSGVVVPLVLMLSLFFSRFLAAYLARVIPNSESSAVTVNSFSGCMATITVGTARKGSAAEASLIDTFNQKHYVLVEPDNDIEQFSVGDKVVLVQKNTNAWQAIRY